MHIQDERTNTTTIYEILLREISILQLSTFHMTNTCEKDWSLSPFLHYIWMSPIFLQPFIDLLFLYIGSYDAFLVMMLGEEKTKHLPVFRSRQDKKKWKCYSLRQLDEKKTHRQKKRTYSHHLQRFALTISWFSLWMCLFMALIDTHFVQVSIVLYVWIERNFVDDFFSATKSVILILKSVYAKFADKLQSDA